MRTLRQIQLSPMRHSTRHEEARTNHVRKKVRLILDIEAGCATMKCLVDRMIIPERI